MASTRLTNIACRLAKAPLRQALSSRLPHTRQSLLTLQPRPAATLLTSRSFTTCVNEKTHTKVSGEEFKTELRGGKPKIGLFVNGASPAIAGQLSFSGYDWLLIDFQHGAMDNEKLSSMINAVHLGNAKVLVRVGGAHDRNGIQQSLDLGADGILVPYINTKAEAEAAVTAARYPTKGTRSVYFPMPSTNEKGLLGYVGNANKNIIVALQVETKACIDNIEAIASIPGLDIAFLGQNDLCMSMGLYEKYTFPLMYTSPELNAATDTLVKVCKKNNVILGLFLFGVDRVGEFLKKGFTFIAVGNDQHHVLTQAGTYVKKVEEIAAAEGKQWKRQPSAII